jgi:hypothetical protein
MEVRVEKKMAPKKALRSKTKKRWPIEAGWKNATPSYG